MSGLSQEAKDAALNYLLANTYVVLTRAGKPVDDLGYRNLRVSWSPPQQGNGSARYVNNDDDLRFGPWQEDASGPIDGWMAVTETGEVRVRQSLPRVENPRKSDELIAYQGTLIVGLT
jgi:hypothetical protein